MSEISEKLPVTQEVAYAEFSSVLRKISEHPFVTEESIEKKRLLKDLVEAMKIELGDESTDVIIPIGSVGVGVALAGSDIDAIVFASNEDQKQKMTTFIRKHEERGDIFAINFSEVIAEAFDQETLKSRAQTTRPNLFGTSIGNASFIFAPALYEDSQPESTIFTMRKKLLEKIVQEYPDKAEAIWDRVRSHLKYFLVLYEFNQFGTEKDIYERSVRVGPIIEVGIRKREGLAFDRKKQHRAEEMIWEWRKRFSYPDLKTMCKAFNVVYPEKDEIAV